MAGMALNRLAHLRRAADLSQSQLAQLLGVDVSAISRYERGLTTIPDKRKLEIADCFGVSVSHLMGWDDETNSNGNGDREAVA
jgi:transcriptional regulator with XRE-family HTH domain